MDRRKKRWLLGCGCGGLALSVLGVLALVDIAQRVDAPYLVLKADARKAAAFGLSSQDVIRQSVTALQQRGIVDRNFALDGKVGEETSITLPFPTDVKLDDVLQEEAKATNVKFPIKLSSLAILQHITPAIEIDHDALQRVLDVRANIAEGNRSEIIADIRKMLQELQVPQGMKVELRE